MNNYRLIVGEDREPASIPNHARVGCCAKCNFTEYVVPDDEGRNVCVDSWACFTRVVWNYRTEVRADLVMELDSLCDKHLFSWMGFRRVKPVTKPCSRCEEDRFAQEDPEALDATARAHFLIAD